jgi:hypothetical protein
VQYKARHGSVWKRSYTSKQLTQNRAIARKWIAAHIQLKAVDQALQKFDSMMHGSGPSESALRLKGLVPREKARIAISRLRDAKVPAARLLEIVLAVHMILKEDPVVDRSKDYRLCQIAKPCMRMASGTHKKWSTTEIHAYPKSSGQFLRHMGAQLETCAEWVVAAHLPEILAAKIEVFGKYQPPEAMPSTLQPNLNFKRPQKKPSAPVWVGGERR